MGYGFDSTYILVLIGIGVTMLASAGLKNTFAKYSNVRSMTGMSGAEVARLILRNNGIFDVSVNKIAGQLTDHYNPASKAVNLSEPIYDSYSIAAVSVAAHECGHAIQDNLGYIPLRLRAAFVPVANIGSRLSWPLIIAGVMIGGMGNMMIQIGIFMFLLAVLFQVITLPVEFNASSRALKQLREMNILPDDEESGAREVLKAAAMTYVASASAGALQLLRLILLFGGRRRDSR